MPEWMSVLEEGFQNNSSDETQNISMNKWSG